MQDQVMELSRRKFLFSLLTTCCTVSARCSRLASVLASSFNLDAVKTVGRVSAYEAADDGLNMTWAPMVDVSRDPAPGTCFRRFWRRYVSHLNNG
ncbi:glycoside hydrolase family 3 N-terminal domain-containing protein [Escherichia coli]